MKVDIAVIGGGIGGTMAALSAAKSGKRVLLTEESDWIGGQLTSQGVPPDEHAFIETEGATQSYLAFRQAVRDHYHRFYPLKEENPLLNPGNGWVSRLAHEPKVAHTILTSMLAPYVTQGLLTIWTKTVPLSAHMEGRRIDAVTVRRLSEEVVVEAKLFIDATELGDLLPLTNTAYTTGAEARSDTLEKDASEVARPNDVQPITHIVALEWREGESHRIEKPAMYEFFASYQPDFFPHRLISEYIPDAATGEPKRLPLFGEDHELPLWSYRRVIDASLYNGFTRDVSLLNWPQNDYFMGTILDVSEEEKERRLEEARQLSLSLVYWLQTEAPRGKTKGYPELALSEALGTKDGLAMYPYIREARRIHAKYRITARDLAVKEREAEGAAVSYWDSVGVGSYHIDLHPTTETNRLFYARSYPFELPLGALIPQETENLLPACKNIGTTQLSNGCYRVHPVEWNIGEVAGAFAARVVERGGTVQEAYADRKFVSDFQEQLDSSGVQRKWSESLIPKYS
ncbi:FAD-dependent oxidoreductase [Paenalkalicoccus suaedae]|uniref:FAD-dependent oxidoreductase n=1 Tax=Paenalkalicoccus suaedae TaxID=2592382 RepID=A0A859FIF6_9BACI|nr:FAD-dependent oxidoreductase [Paenalkalicoccus suaedae]QKS72849.1 FAD-dependent oxidoreductase [Paenalkalicoccus suaedae]